MQRRVQQSRVYTKRTGVGPEVLREPHFRVHVLAPPPQGGESLKGRPVLVAAHGEVLVARGDVDRYGPGRWPGAQHMGGSRFAGYEGGGRVPGPRHRLRARAGGARRVGHRARVHAQRVPSRRVGRIHGQLELDVALLGQYQRRFEHEVVHLVAAHLFGRAQGQLHESGAGQQYRTGHGVVGQPGMSAQRQPAGEEQPVVVGERHQGAQQRMVRGGEPGARHVTGRRRSVEPVTAALEGVRGKVHPYGRAGSAGYRVPVDLGAADEHGGEGGQEVTPTTLVTAQGPRDHRGSPVRGPRDHRGSPVRGPRDHRGSPVRGPRDHRGSPVRDGNGVSGRVGGVLQRLLHAHGQNRVRAALDEDPVAVGRQGPDRRLEAHRAPQVAVPVVGVQRRGVDGLAGERGVEGHLRRTRCDARQRLEHRFADLLHLRRVRGVVHGYRLGPHIVGLAGRHQLGQRRLLSGHHGGRRAVDRRDRKPLAPACQARLGLLQGQRYGGHAALPGQRPDRLAAQGHHLGRVTERQCPGDVGRGDLAL